MTSNLSIRRPPTVAEGAQTITYYLWRAVIAVALMTAGFFPTNASHSTMMAVPPSSEDFSALQNCTILPTTHLSITYQFRAILRLR